MSIATIHDLEERDPTNNLEYTVEMVGYLLGVFIIAAIINEASFLSKFVVVDDWKTD